MEETIMLKINEEIKYYGWMKSDERFDATDVAEEAGRIQGMKAVLEMVTGKKYTVTMSGIYPII